MTAIRLVTIDLDGTLLDSRQQASARSLAALERLLEARVIVALATARDRASIAGRVPLDRPGLYYIACGGAMVYEPASISIPWAETLPPALAAEAVAFLRRFDQPVFVNADCDYWVDRDGDRVAMIERRYDLSTRPFDRVEDVPVPVMRASLAAPRPVLERAAREASAAFGDRASVSLASPDWLDVLGGVSEQIAAHGMFNFLLSDGEHLIGYGHDRLHHLELTGGKDPAVLIASEPLSDDAGWTPFEMGELRIYRAGARQRVSIAGHEIRCISALY